MTGLSNFGLLSEPVFVLCDKYVFLKLFSVFEIKG